MSSSPVYDAIKARLISELGGTYPIRDWEEIETTLQTETAPWISLEDSGGSNALNSIGSPDSNWVTDTGYIDINVMVPSTGGYAAARTIAAAVRQAMMFQDAMVSEGRLRVLSVDPPAPGYVQNGLWQSMVVSLNYEHQYVRATAA